MATTFERIKASVEQQKELKIKGEARKASLQEEAGRVYKTVSETTGLEFSDKEITEVETERVESFINRTKEETEREIMKVAQILSDEGVEY